LTLDETGPSSKALQKTLSLILSPLILLHTHPRSLIQLTLQTTSAPSLRFSKSFKAFSAAAESQADEADDEPVDEGTSAVALAATLNAAVTSLVHAGVAMRGLAAAVAVAVSNVPRPEESRRATGTPRLMLDPSPEEERDADATFVIGFSYGEGHGGIEGDLVWCESCRCRRPLNRRVVRPRFACFLSSEMTRAQLSDAIALAQTASRSVIAFFRKSIEAKYLGEAAVPAPVAYDAMQEG
jgi:exosome complex component RRP46